MEACECLETCPFFNDKMANMPHLSEVYKKKYCKGEYQECARFAVFKAMGREAVPIDLFPNESEKLEAILG